ncbi:hypothetical protein KCU99_g2141, partial [Aureobasidium melanogenum]
MTNCARSSASLAMRIVRGASRPSPFLPSRSARFMSSEPFNPKTYTPNNAMNTEVVRNLLKKSIIQDVPVKEAKTRIELAATYRLFDLAGWNENITNHISAKIVEEDGSESFLLNAYGLKYGEITASSLVKVDYDGNIKDPGVTGDLFGINDAGFVIHSAIHKARPELVSVMHCHHPPATGIACAQEGYLALAQTSHQAGPVAYHDYNGIVIDRGEQKSLTEDAGDKSIMLLRNHGVIAMGRSISEAWYEMYQFLKAAEIQIAAMTCAGGNSKHLIIPSAELAEKTHHAVHEGGFSGSEYGTKELSAYMRWLDTIDDSYRL